MAWISQTVLEAIAAIGGVATTPEIAYRAGLERRPVAKCCRVLRLRNLIACVGVGRFELTDAGRRFLATRQEMRSGPKGPHSGLENCRKGSLRGRLWAALRSLKKASIPDLLQLASSGDELDPTSNAQRYMKALEDAGFVVAMARREDGVAPTSNGFKRYALVRDSGPKAPRLRLNKSEVIDPNSGKSYALGGEA